MHMRPVNAATVKDKHQFQYFAFDEGGTSYMFTAEDGTLWRYDEAVGDYVQLPQEEVSNIENLSTLMHKP